MMSSDNEKIETPPGLKEGESILDYFATGSTPRSAVKRRATDRSSSMPPPKNRRRQEPTDTDLLNQILGRINSVHAEIGILKTSINDLRDEFLNKEVPINNEVQLELMSSDLNLIKTKLGLGTGSVIDEVIHTEDEPTPMITEPSSAPVIKPAEVILEWEEYLKKRKIAVKKYLTNQERHKIHTGWRSLEPPYVPSLYLPKELGYGETAREYEVRKKQKRQEWDAYIELLAIRRDDGLAESQSVDSFIEESISEISETTDAETAMKESLRSQYEQRIKADQKEIEKQCKNLEEGLKTKPARDEKHIVISEDRVYAKALKKGLTTNETDDTQETSAKPMEEEWNLVSKQKKSKPRKKKNPPPSVQPAGNKQGKWKREKKMDNIQPSKLKQPMVVESLPQAYYQLRIPTGVQQTAAVSGFQQPQMGQYYQQPGFQQPAVQYQGGGYQQVITDYSHPPPTVFTAQPGQSENSSFQWGKPNTRWKQLSPDCQI